MLIEPFSSPASTVGAFAALLAPGQDGDLQPGPFSKRCDRREMLARKDFRRRHQRCLSTCLGRARHREQRDHGFARADIALEQAQHAVGTREIGVDFGQRLLLGSRQRVGQRGANLLRRCGRRL